MKTVTTIIDLSPLIYRASMYGIDSLVRDRVDEADASDINRTRQNIIDMIHWIGSAAWILSERSNISVRSLLVADCKPYWRSDHYLPYKQARKPKSALFRVALEAIQSDQVSELMNHYGLQVATQPGYEADDLAAYYSQNHGSDCCILVSLDTDWLQLVRHGEVYLWSTYHSTLFNTADVLDFVGKKVNKLSRKRQQAYTQYTTDRYVSPAHQAVISLKRAAGDSSDNIEPDADRWLTDLICENKMEKPPLDTMYLQQILSEARYQSDSETAKDLVFEFNVGGKFIPVPVIKSTR